MKDTPVGYPGDLCCTYIQVYYEGYTSRLSWRFVLHLYPSILRRIHHWVILTVCAALNSKYTMKDTPVGYPGDLCCTYIQVYYEGYTSRLSWRFVLHLYPSILRRIHHWVILAVCAAFNSKYTTKDTPLGYPGDLCCTYIQVYYEGYTIRLSWRFVLHLYPSIQEGYTIRLSWRFVLHLYPSILRRIHH